MSFLQNLFCNLDDFDWSSKTLIGQGSFGDCYSVRAKKRDPRFNDDSNIFIRDDPEGMLYCAKITNKKISGAKEQENLLREVLIIKKVQHPAVLEFKGFNLYDFEGNPLPTFITPKMFTSLDDVMKNEKKYIKKGWNVTKKQICIIGVASAMCYLHSLNIIHRDLKPANILLDKNFYPKVCDFGFARSVAENVQKTQGVGTPYFMAPEILQGNDDYDKPVDVYSFAIFAYQIITGKVPFPNVNQFQLSKKVIRGDRPSFEGCEISDEFKGLIELCWKTEAYERPNFEFIYNKLVDDCTLLINDHVDRNELTEYISSLKEKTKGKEKLVICSTVPLPIVTGESKAHNQEIPDDEKIQDEMLEQVFNNNFNKFSNEIRMKLFLKVRSRLLNNSDYKSFIKIINYENSLAIREISMASEFLNRTFQEVKFDGLAEITKRDLREFNSKKIFDLNVSPSVRSIKDGAFKGKLIQYINLHATIDNIEKEAFMNCTKLVFINLTNRMTEIKKSTFEKCTDLSYVEFPSSLSYIRENAFRDCTSLTEIWIPESVVLIESNAFYGCKSLKIVHISQKTEFNKRNSFPMVSKHVYYE
ncbi:hypothetical protein M9Y10_041036 [Tritrichomonas musculus]|uniref:Protein kinase domain-containing protein n=1 Tax=Tritrichomonas musculus TaxID=1915356 RepID=A0ABR2K3T4_9EUKA